MNSRSAALSHQVTTEARPFSSNDPSQTTSKSLAMPTAMSIGKTPSSSTVTTERAPAASASVTSCTLRIKSRSMDSISEPPLAMQWTQTQLERASTLTLTPANPTRPLLWKLGRWRASVWPLSRTLAQTVSSLGRLLDRRLSSSARVLLAPVLSSTTKRLMRMAMRWSRTQAWCRPRIRWAAALGHLTPLPNSNSISSMAMLHLQVKTLPSLELAAASSVAHLPLAQLSSSLTKKTIVVVSSVQSLTKSTVKCQNLGQLLPHWGTLIRQIM